MAIASLIVKPLGEESVTSAAAQVGARAIIAIASSVLVRMVIPNSLPRPEMIIPAGRERFARHCHSAGILAAHHANARERDVFESRRHAGARRRGEQQLVVRSEEHTSELQSLRHLV